MRRVSIRRSIRAQLSRAFEEPEMPHNQGDYDTQLRVRQSPP